MLCQKCGHSNATVHREKTVYRQKVEEHLCEFCAGIGIAIEQSSERVSLGHAITPDLDASHAIFSSANRPKEIVIPKEIIVQNLASRLCARPLQIIRVLMEFGIYTSIQAKIDYPTAARVCERLGVHAQESDEILG